MNVNVKHKTEVLKSAQKDGDFNAVVIRLESTGDSGAVEKERYRHVLTHNLGRCPVGCQIILKSGIVDMYVLESNENDITVKFNAARIAVNIRIW